MYRKCYQTLILHDCETVASKAFPPTSRGNYSANPVMFSSINGLSNTVFFKGEREQTNSSAL